MSTGRRRVSFKIYYILYSGQILKEANYICQIDVKFSRDLGSAVASQQNFTYVFFL